MGDTVGFKGFPKDTVKFYGELALNNNKEWFAENKPRFDEQVMAPSRLFVRAMGDKLRAVAPAVNADPRVNKSLFRINRDTRFSHDKTPYKDHLGIWFWEGAGKRMESSGFYFQLSPAGVLLGAGLYCFPKAWLAAYREAVADPKKGAGLQKILRKLCSSGEYETMGLHYKRTPRGYPRDHPNEELLRHNGLAVRIELGLPPELGSPKLVDYCFRRYRAMLPVHKWLMDLNQNLQG